MSEQVNKPLATKEQIDNADVMYSIAADIAVLMSKVATLPKARERAIVNSKLEEAWLYCNLDLERNHKI